MTSSYNLFCPCRLLGWLFMLAYFTFTQAALGPLMPFLRTELNLSYTVTGFTSALLL